MKNIKPSQLIKLALEDLELVEADREHYRVNMNSWHTPGIERCEVCLAGAVMAMTLHASPKENHGPGSYPECYNQLSALNAFRCGSVGVGLDQMNVSRPKKFASIFPVMPYGVDRARFKQDMWKMADRLEACGI